MVLRKSGSILRLVPSCAFAVVIAAGTAAAYKIGIMMHAQVLRLIAECVWCPSDLQSMLRERCVEVMTMDRRELAGVRQRCFHTTENKKGSKAKRVQSQEAKIAEIPM